MAIVYPLSWCGRDWAVVDATGQFVFKFDPEDHLEDRTHKEAEKVVQPMIDAINDCCGPMLVDVIDKKVRLDFRHGVLYMNGGPMTSAEQFTILDMNEQKHLLSFFGKSNLGEVAAIFKLR